jgi:uncharacterized protein YprB with RNaseH-like and TPR domain
MKLTFFDIETSPLEVYAWGTFDQNIGLDMIKTEWSVLSWAAKEQGKKKIHQMDVEKTSEKKMLEGMWKILDESEIVVTQNGVKFDAKKLNARFIAHGMTPPSSYRHIDTLKLARKNFAFTSNKLEYMAKFLGTKHQKLKHKDFPGFELWAECLKGNPKAWKEMRKYNKYDVIVLEEVYNKLIIWDPAFRTPEKCTCGSTSYKKIGFFHSAAGTKYQRYRCNDCGAEVRDRKRVKE